MARPLSEAKRAAILAAATRLVATLGLGAPTARIAREAGLAEGTLFTYFASKDALLNQLYRDIKTDLAEAMLRDYPAGDTAAACCRHIWDRFIDWGAAAPLRHKAMRQLTVSDRITEDSRHQGALPFREINDQLARSLADGTLKPLPPAFLAAALEALAETTLEFIARDPDHRAAHKQAGFILLWSGITA